MMETQLIRLCPRSAPDPEWAVPAPGTAMLILSRSSVRQRARQDAERVCVYVCVCVYQAGWETLQVTHEAGRTGVCICLKP